MREAYQRFLNDFQICGTDNEFSSLNGPPLVEVVRRLMLAHSLPYDADTLATKYFGIIDQLYSGVSPAHGARQLLLTAKSQGCLVSVVTSNSANRTSTWLTRVGLAQFVDFIISGEQVKYGKPDPEPYLLASRKVGYPVDRIIAIEDSIQGATSAIGAGLYTYLLTSVCNEPIACEGAVQALSLEQITVDVWGVVDFPKSAKR